MSRTRTILLVGNLVLSLAACGGDDDAKPVADAAVIDGGAVKDAAATTDASSLVDAAVTQVDAAATTDAPKSDTAASDSAVADAANTVDTAKDTAPASTCLAPDAGAACNALTNAAPAITIGAGTGAMPTGTGGTIVDGTYFLTTLKAYPGSPIAGFIGGPFKQMLVIAGCVTQLVEGTNVFKTSTLAPNGIVPNFNLVCSSKAGDVNIVYSSYTATATTLSIYSTDIAVEATFTKQ